MATSGRRPSTGRQYAFSPRNLTVCFGLIAIVVFAVGVAVKAAGGATDARPVAAVVVGLPAFCAVLVMRRGRVAPAAPEEDSPGETNFEAMAPDEFEQAVADLCERDGCQIIRVEGGAGDLGADVLATAPDGRRVVIQCKRYDSAHKVGSQEVQRFGGTCFAVHDAQIAVVVTTSEFTEPAVEYATQCGILCVDGQELARWASTGPAPWTE